MRSDPIGRPENPLNYKYILKKHHWEQWRKSYLHPLLTDGNFKNPVLGMSMGSRDFTFSKFQI